MVVSTVNTVTSDATTVVSIPLSVTVDSGEMDSRLLELDASISDAATQELPNMALAPEEVATLRSLVDRYDRVIQDLDQLNEQIESLLQAEGIKACES